MPDLLQHVCVKVEISVSAKVCSAKGSLEGVRVLDTQFSPNDDTSCRLLGFLDCKATVDKAESISLSLQYKWKHSFCVLIIFGNWVAVHENVFLAGVSVNITDQEHFSVLLEFFNHHLCVIDRRVQFFIWIYPLSIQVDSSKVAPGIPVDDTIRIQHGNNLKHKVVAENSGSQTRPN